VEDYLGTERPGCGHLNKRCGQRHYDLSANATGGGVEGDTLSMIAGAGRDYSAFAFRLAECEQFVESAALLEGACALQIFKLQIQGKAGQL
jgi:hypothetical protein